MIKCSMHTNLQNPYNHRQSLQSPTGNTMYNPFDISRYYYTKFKSDSIYLPLHILYTDITQAYNEYNTTNRT